MLTKGQNSKFRAVKYVAMVLALVALLAFCFTSCGKGEVISAEYLAGSLEKDQYQAGETFDCTGAQMKVTYANGDFELVDVTATMVGAQELSFGMSYVEATYSVDGSSVKCMIPVTVIDPYSNEKTAAIAAINARDDVKNSKDGGVAAKVTEYVNKINAATTKDDIAALSDAFAADLKAYLDGKAAALARVSLTEAELAAQGLYQQFLLDVKHAQTLAIANIKAALSVEEAEDIAEAFEDTIAKKLAEQVFYEGSTDAEGQIKQKLELLSLINLYIKKADGYIATINANSDADAAKADDYENAKNLLEMLKEEVRLAINLTKVELALKEVIEKHLTTPLDEIYALIKDGHVVKPAPYDTETGALATTDPTKELIDKYDELYGDAEEIFGVAGALQEAQGYKYDLTSTKIDLDAIFDAIKAKRGELEDKQEAIATLNATVATWAGTNAIVPTAGEIYAAWNELGEWGAATIAASTNAIMFTPDYYDASTGAATKSFYGAFELDYVVAAEDADGVKGYADNFKLNADADDVADHFLSSYVDEAYLTGYFFPALSTLKAATEAAEDAIEDLLAKVLVMGPIVVTHKLDGEAKIDAGDRIAAAEKAYADYVDAYGTTYTEDVHHGSTLQEQKDAIDAARLAYNALVAQAKALNAMIEGLGDAKEIVLSDFAANDDATIDDDGKLLKAYTAYHAFLAVNKDTIKVDGVDKTYGPYDDVISDPTGYSDATTKVDNKAHLLDCMKNYVLLDYIEEVKVQGELSITGAYVKVMGKTDPVKDTMFRTALGSKKTELLGKLPTIENYKHTDADGNPEDLFNVLTILNDNLVASKKVAEDLAAEFVAFYNANKADSMPEFEDIQ